jgi:hypothetical protein
VVVVVVVVCVHGYSANDKEALSHWAAIVSSTRLTD